MHEPIITIEDIEAVLGTGREPEMTLEDVTAFEDDFSNYPGDTDEADY